MEHFGSAQCKDGAWDMEKGLPRINFRQIGSLFSQPSVDKD